MARKAKGAGASPQVLASRPFAPGESHSISTRRVENGYMTCVSTCGPDGEYKYAESFSKEPPKITPPRAEGGGETDTTQSEGLRGTREYLGKDV